MLATLEPQLGPTDQRPAPGARARGSCRRLILPADLDTRIGELEDHARRALRGRERELEVSTGPRISLDALHLGELLHARLCLSRLGCLVAESRDEPLHPLDLLSLRRDRPADRDFAACPRAPPPTPSAGEL